MADDRRPCPQCGEPVYPTDDVCMSCGLDLQARAAPAPPIAAPAPAVAPGPWLRPEPSPSFSQRLVTRCGKAWDVYPWVGIACYAILGLSFAVELPSFITVPTMVVYVPWMLLYLGWLICDVIANGADWWWIPVGLVCYPFGFVIYLLWGR